MAHTRQEKRANNWKHAIRKRKIARAIYCDDKDYYDNLHQFSKNKIHCSCPDCRGKDSHLGENSDAQRKFSERKKIESIKTKMNEEN